MTEQIPEEFRDLLEGPHVVTLATLLPDGQPHLSAMWCTLEGNDVLFSTTRERQKADNVAADQRATVIAWAADDPYRYIEVRGKFEEPTEEGGVDLINRLAKLYTGNDEYYGGVASIEQKEKQTRIILRLKPERVRTH